MPKTKLVLKCFLLCLVPALVVAGCVNLRSDMLLDSWKFYKNKYISQDGRVIDFQRDSVTTSEGQSYAMLRSVLADDPQTFELVYTWAKNNLKRSNDSLFAWLWGKKQDNTWGIIDKNSASDADVDIAFSLILAYKKWGNKEYLLEAKKIISNIWELETKSVKNKRILISGVEQAKKHVMEINPSYFAPYAFRMFYKYDKKHNWDELVDSSYDLLNKVSSLTSTGLPPNWCLMDSETGKIFLYKEDSSKNDFSYDSIRVFMRTYLDYAGYKDKRAMNILEKAKFFMRKYPEPGKDFIFYTNYKADGNLRDKDENIGAVSILVPVLKLFDANYAKITFDKKIAGNYNPKGYWADPDNYYTQNLAWFGVWVYLNE